MNQNNTIQIFENKKVRSLWDAEQEKWYISIVDVIGVLTDSPNPNNYWKVLKNRLKKEGSELVTNCNQLKMQSADGKFYKTVRIQNNCFASFNPFQAPKRNLLNVVLRVMAKIIE